jgi:hypothetical protein
VMISVSDAGQGFRASLEPTRGGGARWDDRAALEAAMLRATSRFHDAGRGQGLLGIRKYVAKWKAKMTVRSGSARIGIIPDWDSESPMLENLAPFPGAQLQITIPQVVE